MSDEDEKTFRVTIEDCKRWSDRLERMAKALQKKPSGRDDSEDNRHMFLTASILMQKLGLDIQEDMMFAETRGLFGDPTIGEA